MTVNESDGVDGPDVVDMPSTVRSHSRSTAIPSAAHVDVGRRPEAWSPAREETGAVTTTSAGAWPSNVAGTGSAGRKPPVAPVCRRGCPRSGLRPAASSYKVIDDAIVFRTAPDSVPAAAVGTEVAFEVDRVDEALSQGWGVFACRPRERRDAARGRARAHPTRHTTPWAGGERQARRRSTPCTEPGAPSPSQNPRPAGVHHRPRTTMRFDTASVTESDHRLRERVLWDGLRRCRRVSSRRSGSAPLGAPADALGSRGSAPWPIV